jgi:ferric-dicitrate binding protein FerR (iron transport regulator)
LLDLGGVTGGAIERKEMPRGEKLPCEVLKLRACVLLLALRQAPDSVERRAALINWVQEDPAHRQAFDALNQSLEAVAQLLEQDRVGP